MIILLSFLIPFLAHSFTFGVITDIHLDLGYDPEVGRLDHCKKGGKKANFPALYGRKGCDTPYSLLVSCIEELKKKKIDAILVAGDLANHFSHIRKKNPFNNETYRRLKNIIENCTITLKRAFPNTPIIFTPGNNDFLYNYQLPSPELKEDYYEFLYNTWIKNINANKEADIIENKFSFMNSGSYSINVTNEVKVISLNCVNFAVRRNDSTAGLDWLEEVLEKTEKMNMKAILLYHFPHGFFHSPIGREAYWDRKYARGLLSILRKYKKTISIIVTGHTHISYIQCMHGNRLEGYSIENQFRSRKQHNNDTIDDDFSSSMIVARGLSPMLINNPGFGLLYFKGTTPTLYEEYSFLLKHSFNSTNVSASKYWVKLYDTNHDYKLQNLTAEEIARFVKRIYEDVFLLAKYYFFKIGVVLPRFFETKSKSDQIEILAREICKCYYYEDQAYALMCAKRMQAKLNEKMLGT